MMNIYCQGKIVPQNEARIPVGDHGFLYGASLFETFRTYRGQPFLLEDHVNRLLRGCRAYGIRPGHGLAISEPPSYPRLQAIIQELLIRNGLDDAFFRYTLSAGESPPGLPVTSFDNPTEIIFVRPLPQSPSPTSIQLHLLNTVRTEPEVFPRPKSGHYMNSVIALRELRERQAEPGDEGLLVTADGQLSEGTTSNLFLVSENILLTPSPAAHILEGITRGYVLTLAASLGIQSQETGLNLADLTGADAIFMTNSIRGITPVHEVLGRNGETVWKNDFPINPLVERLFAAYGAFPEEG